LFYLRGVAPKEVKSSDIYWGALPWVGLQLVLVALVIAFPKQVTMFLDKPKQLDLDKVKIELPTETDPSKAQQDKDEDDLQKALGAPQPGKSDPPAPPPKPGTPKKTEEEKAAEEIEKQLKGLK
jgi:hypothetical protein